jgi:hypothetical protein
MISFEWEKVSIKADGRIRKLFYCRLCLTENELHLKINVHKDKTDHMNMSRNQNKPKLMHTESVPVYPQLYFHTSLDAV